MREITLKGKQEFRGTEIPIICGGFSRNQKCISDKTIAELHSAKETDIRKIIAGIKRFKENVDFIDLKQCRYKEYSLEAVETWTLLHKLGYTKQTITQAEHIYLLSKCGYVKLIKIFDTDLAWEIYDNLLDEYFYLEENQKIDILQLNYDKLNRIIDLLVSQNGELKQLKAVLTNMPKVLRDLEVVDQTPRPDYRFIELLHENIQMLNKNIANNKPTYEPIEPSYKVEFRERLRTYKEVLIRYCVINKIPYEQYLK